MPQHQATTATSTHKNESSAQNSELTELSAREIQEVSGGGIAAGVIADQEATKGVDNPLMAAAVAGGSYAVSQ